MVTRKQLEQEYIQDKAFWASVKGRWRGLAGGLIVGGIMGALTGLAATALFSAFSPTDAAVSSGTAAVQLTTQAITGIVGVFASAGMLIGMNLWSGAGQVSGAVASALVAQKEIEQGQSKQLEQTIDITKPVDVPEEKKPLIHWKVAGIGMAASAATGAFLAYNGMLPAGVSGFAALGQQVGTGAAAAAAATTFGLFGAAFGVGFNVWQGAKQWADGLFEPKLDGRTVGSADQIIAHLRANEPEPALSQPKTTHAAEELQRRSEKPMHFSRI